MSTVTPTARRWGRAVVVAVAVGIPLTGCSEAGPSQPEARLPKGAPVVNVSVEDYRFRLARTVPAGRVVFRMVNNGRAVHQPGLFPLPDDLPPLDEQLKSAARRPLTPFAGPFPQGQGQTVTFAVDLVKGRRYGLLCFMRDRNVGLHSRYGMNAEFRAGRHNSTRTGRPPSTIVAPADRPVPSTTIGQAAVTPTTAVGTTGPSPAATAAP